jgi:hypothetical protein
MNRRNFITTTALTLPSLTLFGAFMPTKTYRSVNSLFSNEELTDWCKQNGGHYAQDDELVESSIQATWSRYFPVEKPNAYKTPNRSFRHLPFVGIDGGYNKYTLLNLWLKDNRRIYPNSTFILKDIYKADSKINNREYYLMAIRREKMI